MSNTVSRGRPLLWCLTQLLLAALTVWLGITIAVCDLPPTVQVTRLCKDRGIPCHLLDVGEKARRKQEWEEATSGSDTEPEWELS